MKRINIQRIALAGVTSAILLLSVNPNLSQQQLVQTSGKHYASAVPKILNLDKEWRDRVNSALDVFVIVLGVFGVGAIIYGYWQHYSIHRSD